MKFRINQTPDGGSFFFQVLSDNDQELLRSGNYPNRDAITDAVRRAIDLMNSEDTLQAIAEGGGTIIVLRGADNQSLASSQNFGRRTDATAHITRILEDAGDQNEYEVTLTTPADTGTAALPSFLGSAFTDFETLYDFTRSSQSGKTGPELFQNDTDQQYYFHFNNNSGKAILYSRSFRDSSRRKKRIAQVIKNASRDDKYERHVRDGQHYFILNGSNGKEIARSPLFATENLRETAIDFLKGKAPDYAEAYAPVKRKRKKKAVNEYVISHRSSSGKEGFEAFRNDETRQHYFHFNDEKGTALLYSQGYTSIKSRDNGIRSVIKNAGNRSRFELREKNGAHHFILRAGNRQEIARSRDFKSGGEAERFIPYLVGAITRFAGVYGVDSRELSKTKTETFTIAFDRTETAATPSAVAASVKTTPAAAARSVDDYLPCEDYKGDPGFYTFYREDRKEYYFSYINQDGDVLLRSEGYTTAAARNNGIKSVKKNAPIEKRWVKDSARDGKYHYYALRAGNHQEIARSCYFEDKKRMLGFLGWLTGAAGIAGLTGVAIAAKPTAAAVKTAAPKPTAAAVKSTPPQPAAAIKTAAPKPAAAAVTTTSPRPAAASAAVPAPSGGFPWKWILPLLLLLALLFLIPYLLRGCGDTDANMSAGASSSRSVPGLVSDDNELRSNDAGQSQITSENNQSGVENRSAGTPTTAPNASAGAEGTIPTAPRGTGPDASAMGFDSNSLSGRLADFLSNPGRRAPETFVLENVNFNSDSDQLLTSAVETLKRVSKVLKAYPGAKFRLTGYTDSQGDPAYNRDLSMRRAKAVADYLVGTGIAEHRREYTGLGNEAPRTSNATAAGRYQNRRVEISIVEK